MDKQLRREQAGFRKGRSCTDQIFTLRNIIEQCMEWQASLHLNFIDFEKLLTVCIGHPMETLRALWHPTKDHQNDTSFEQRFHM